MIRSTRHSARKRFLRRGDSKRLPRNRLRRIKANLQVLSFASRTADMAAIAGAHRLRGDRAGGWPFPVSANWRTVFRSEDGRGWDVDRVDYR